MDQLTNIYQSVLAGDMGVAQEKVRTALTVGVSAEEILNKGLIAAMDEVGRLFELGEYYVPEMLISARAMQAALEILKPKLAETGVEPIGMVIIGTVKGDLHDIGKNLVAMMMEGAGFQINDLGSDVTAEQFVEAVQNGGDIVGFSAVLTTTMPSMEAAIKALDTAGLREQVKIIVGGAPVTPDYAQQIGADGYAADASRAVTLAKSLVK